MSNPNPSNPVLIDKSDNILHIEFNRPDKKNALTLEMYKLAAIALEQANTDPQVRVVIISGRGDTFTAGNDLSAFLEAPASAQDNPLLRFLYALPACTKPVITAISGHAVGIGTTMLLHCDLNYADRSARLQMPFVNLGLCPEFGSSLLLPQLIGQKRAADLLLSGRVIDANTAKEYGLINEVVEGDCLAYSREKALALAAQPPASLRLTKRLLTEPYRQQILEVIDQEIALFNEALQSDEAKEALTAFMERRTPDFSQFD